MQCPRCKTHDVYLSRSANTNLLSFVAATVRCHRCCYLFTVPRWSAVEKAPDESAAHQQQKRRAA